MKYVKLPESYPYENVNVHIVTESGMKGTARYWPDLDKWLTDNKHIKLDDPVVKWRYADAVLDIKSGETYSHLNLPYEN